jgi:hypothetical protein
MPEIAINVKGLGAVKDLMLELGNNSKRALSRTINRTVNGVRTDITVEIKDSVDLTTAFIQKQTGMKSQRTFFIHRATPSYPRGSISTRGANVPLVQYSNQRGTRKRFPKSIKVRVKKDRGYHKVRHMFIPVLKSGHRGLFETIPGSKTAAGNTKIKQKYGPRVPDILSNKEVLSKVERKAGERLQKNLTHEVDYLLSIV